MTNATHSNDGSRREFLGTVAGTVTLGALGAAAASALADSSSTRGAVRESLRRPALSLRLPPHEPPTPTPHRCSAGEAPTPPRELS